VQCIVRLQVWLLSCSDQLICVSYGVKHADCWVTCSSVEHPEFDLGLETDRSVETKLARKGGPRGLPELRRTHRHWTRRGQANRCRWPAGRRSPRSYVPIARHIARPAGPRGWKSVRRGGLSTEKRYTPYGRCGSPPRSRRGQRAPPTESTEQGQGCAAGSVRPGRQD
jgi:hypothetical protein